MKQPWTRLMALLLLMGLPAHSQESRRPPAEVTLGDAAGRLSGPIDFWGRGPASEKAPRSPLEEIEIGPGRIRIRETVWAQPVRTPDGSWVLYVPPKPILDFLENPSESTAKAYVAWKSEQAEKLGRAMKLLNRRKEALASPQTPSVPPTDTKSAEPPTRNSAKLLYFKKPSCPHCISQDAVLGPWLSRHPGVRAEVILAGEQPELWKTYGVRGTPTLVFGSEGGDQEVLVGLQSEAQLDAALGRTGLVTTKPSGEIDKERAK